MKFRFGNSSKLPLVALLVVSLFLFSFLSTAIGEEYSAPSGTGDGSMPPPPPPPEAVAGSQTYPT